RLPCVVLSPHEHDLACHRRDRGRARRRGERRLGRCGGWHRLRGGRWSYVIAQRGAETREPTQIPDRQAHHQHPPEGQRHREPRKVSSHGDDHGQPFSPPPFATTFRAAPDFGPTQRHWVSCHTHGSRTVFL